MTGHEKPAFDRIPHQHVLLVQEIFYLQNTLFFKFEVFCISLTILQNHATGE